MNNNKSKIITNEMREKFYEAKQMQYMRYYEYITLKDKIKDNYALSKDEKERYEMLEKEFKI